MVTFLTGFFLGFWATISAVIVSIDITNKKKITPFTFVILIAGPAIMIYKELKRK